MGGKSRRERSATTQSARSDMPIRPPSRASTESINAAASLQQATELQHQHSFTGYTNEEQALVHQLSNTGNMVDPSLQGFGQQMPNLHMQATHQGYAPLSQNYEQLYGGPVGAPSGAETDEKGKKRGPGATAANDKELRELLRQNESRNLKEVAVDVIANERTSKSEKTKQLFAMLW